MAKALNKKRPSSSRQPAGAPSKGGEGNGPTARPIILVEGGGLSEQASAGEAAILRAGTPVYQRGPSLVRPVLQEVDAADGRRTTVAQLAPIGLPYMRDLLCRTAEWRRFERQRGVMVAMDPPPAVAQVILHRYGEWRFRPVTGILTTPTMRPDGSLLLEPGYDAATRLILCEPPAMEPIPNNPSRRQALAALEVLDALLEEFPFADGASRSVALSALITPVVRAAFPVAPMHIMSAPEAGSGKSYLLDVVAAIALGQPCPVMAAGRTEEETEKRLGAAVLAGQPIIAIDNVNGDLGGDALCQIIERPIVEIRILGKSERVRVETRSTTFATGNNIGVVADMTRRILRCRLDAKREQPELRQFRRRPVATVLADRGCYVAAALTLARAFVATGMPRQAPRLASFERWSDLVRSSLLWLGRADPVETMRSARAEEPARRTMVAVFSAIRETIGTETPVTAAELIRLANTMTSGNGAWDAEATGEPRQFPELYEALLEISERHGRIDARELGKWLSRHRDRIGGRLRLEGKSDRHGHAARWWLVSGD